MSNANPVTPPRYNLGDRVEITHTFGKRGRIVEWRGPLGPGGVQVYRVRTQRRPKPSYIEVCEDQLILIPPTPPDAGGAA